MIDDGTPENDAAMMIEVLEEIAPEDGPRAARRGEIHAKDEGIHLKNVVTAVTATENQSRALPRSKAPLPSQNDAYSSSEVARTGESSAPPPEKEKPNFGNTGRLAAETNTVNVSGGTVVLKYHEPPEARKPPAKDPWRLYVFKGDDLLEVVELAERSCWLIGRERLVADFPLDHPSCSKQHAAIQFRYVEKRNEFGDRIGKVKPYIIDLESANGSHVNGDTIPAGRYVELRDKDVLKFGLSSREYVLMLPQPD
ncbi:hypothetical protein CNMCM8980_004174 [Aspergillus fumigatiaffinis]|uniref:FHA domain-containing protein n=1 Tax=Aspergillus fumigatiaffinis TaxID=340414 RepID=A0A8H4H1Y7_9EURO|nr:hypothetical protein CNMCM5878_007698 [Aspergillus fumigatiaffinis]KAF4233717.1 hypothetical protein CNMCM6457_004350 [Aspergillus fumigatiaffinis]KAF4239530.1 hypothetical protein CNMCM6805_005741 [Aspergillus fumigatiaffinis]KAF4249218.1 hypothetical protein CNMCM8980_004174 [Aspergillus fumigatiaffinis]